MARTRSQKGSQSQPSHTESFPSVADMLNQLQTAQPPKPRKDHSASIRNIPSVLNQLATFSSASTVTTHNKCPFMQLLSTDVRSQIYSYLLINPILSTADAISRDTDFGLYQKYELHPSILGTCKEIYEEASAVLYGLNIFYMVAMKSKRMYRFTLADFIGGSALTRYWKENADIFNVAPESRLYLCKVRQWRVEVDYYGSPSQSEMDLTVVSTKTPLEYKALRRLNIDPRTDIPPPGGRRRHGNHYLVRLGHREGKYLNVANQLQMVSYLRPLLEYSLVPFCHLISLSKIPPQTLEIIFRPKKIWGEVPLKSEYLGMVPTEEEKLGLIKPLEMLRGVGSLKFTCGETPGISAWQRANHQDLQELVTSGKENRPVEYPSNMYANLLSYAQAFERYGPFKQRMGANWLYQNSYKSTPNPYQTKAPNPIQYSNPFGPNDDNYQSHPVTRHLSGAAAAVRRHDIAAFREQRKAVIEFLEPQYMRIVCEARKFIEFLNLDGKENGKRYCIWEAIATLQGLADDFERDKSKTSLSYGAVLKKFASIDYAEALVVLEEYAEAFNRDIPHETRKQIARIRFEYNSHYDIMEREVAIRKLQRMVVNMVSPWQGEPGRFKQLYMIAANDMQKQFVEIRQARKRLFEDDGFRNAKECPIDLGLEMEDKEIDWNMPRVNPASQ